MAVLVKRPSTGRNYVLRVPPTHQNCARPSRTFFNIPTDKYRPIAQSWTRRKASCTGQGDVVLIPTETKPTRTIRLTESPVFSSPRARRPRISISWLAS